MSQHEIRTTTAIVKSVILDHQDVRVVEFRQVIGHQNREVTVELKEYRSAHEWETVDQYHAASVQEAVEMVCEESYVSFDEDELADELRSDPYPLDGLNRNG